MAGLQEGAQQALQRALALEGTKEDTKIILAVVGQVEQPIPQGERAVKVEEEEGHGCGPVLGRSNRFLLKYLLHSADISDAQRLLAVLHEDARVLAAGVGALEIFGVIVIKQGIGTAPAELPLDR